VTERISVLICTMNRPTELRRCLESVRASGVPVAQIVVSDDSTDSRTREMVRSEFDSVQYVEGPKRGLCANRNRALSAATCDLVLFMDDDACLGGRFLECALRARMISAAPERAIVTGCHVEHGRLIRAHDQSFLGFQNVPYGPGQRIKTIVMISALFPRGLFDVVRFDENLVYGYDEVDIATQALSHGYEIVHCEEAVNSHHPSVVNRAGYRPHTDASRLYVTFKRYARYERAYTKAAIFALLAPLHCVVAATRRRGLPGLRDSWLNVRSAVRFAISSGASVPRG
jgi:GT2 family glycosyltransferase